jgi:hypothetical protein
MDSNGGPTEVQKVARAVAEERDRGSHGQRRVNLIWEVTQAGIALLVTIAQVYVATKPEQFETATLSNAFFLVVGFYFGRTNHQKTGGVPLRGAPVEDSR